MSNKLTEIPQNELCNMKNMFKNDWPKHVMPYYLIENYDFWFKKYKRNENVKIFTLNNDWKKFGTFVIIDRYRLFMYTLDETSEELETILNLIDWSKGFVACACQRHVDSLKKIFNDKNLPIEHSFILNLHYLPKEEANKFDITTPNGICLKQLNHSYVPMINQAWAHKHDGSLFYLERLIERNLSIGAFNKNDNELIAWCLRIENGSFGNLQVSENHQRRGLGSFLVKLMSKKLAEENIDSTAGILDSNQKSREMFQKLGFKHIDNTYWFTISSSIPNFQWTD